MSYWYTPYADRCPSYTEKQLKSKYEKIYETFTRVWIFNFICIVRNFLY